MYPPNRVQWPKQAEEDFFSEIYDWDTLEIVAGSISRLSLTIELCSDLFPCHLSVEGTKGGDLLRSSIGSILCQNEIGCSGVQVLGRSFIFRI